MKIAVMIKQVPGTTNVEVDSVTGVLKRDGIENKLNPYDLYAVEETLKIREEFGGEVTTVTMGPLQAKAAIKEAICMGADMKYANKEKIAVVARGSGTGLEGRCV